MMYKKKTIGMLAFLMAVKAYAHPSDSCIDTPTEIVHGLSHEYNLDQETTLKALEAYDALSQTFGGKDILARIDRSNPDTDTMQALGVIANIIDAGADPNKQLGLYCD